MLIDDLQILEGKFLVGLGSLNNGGWFVWTNPRLIQRGGRSDEFKEVTLTDAGSYQVKGTTQRPVMPKLKSGEEVTFAQVQMHPRNKVISGVIS